MQFITVLAGANFRPAEAKTALAFVRDQKFEHRLSLERDPENAYDANAIKVILTITEGGGESEPQFIGYVAGADAIQLAPYLDNDEERRDNNGNPLWVEGHEPAVERCEILDFVSGPLKPTIVIEVSTGYELGTLVKGPDADGDGDDDFLSGEEEVDGEGDED